MLAKGELNVFGIICSASYYLNIIPIKYDLVARLVSIEKSRLRRIIYYISRFYSIAYLAFALFRIYPAYEGFGIKYPTYYAIFHAIHVILHIFTVMFDTVIAAYLEDIVLFFNQLVNMNKQLGNTNYSLN